LVLENINNKNRNVLTAKCQVNFGNFTLTLKLTKLNSQTKMTKSISQKITISNLEWGINRKTGSNESGQNICDMIFKAQRFAWALMHQVLPGIRLKLTQYKTNKHQFGELSATLKLGLNSPER